MISLSGLVWAQSSDNNQCTAPTRLQCDLSCIRCICNCSICSCYNGDEIYIFVGFFKNYYSNQNPLFFLTDSTGENLQKKILRFISSFPLGL